MVGSSRRATLSLSSSRELSDRARILPACSTVSVRRPAKSASDKVIPTRDRPARTASASTSPSAAPARSPAGRKGGILRLTITLPIGRSRLSSSSIASMVSWIGRASNSVTKWIAVWSECRSRTTLSAWECTGPPLARSEIAWVTSRNRAIRPVGGASTTTAS